MQASPGPETRVHNRRDLSGPVLPAQTATEKNPARTQCAGLPSNSLQNCRLAEFGQNERAARGPKQFKKPIRASIGPVARPRLSAVGTHAWPGRADLKTTPICPRAMPAKPSTTTARKSPAFGVVLRIGLRPPRGPEGASWTAPNTDSRWACIL
jgi:hypothetical protein